MELHTIRERLRLLVASLKYLRYDLFYLKLLKNLNHTNPELYVVQRSLILVNVHIYIFGIDIATQQLHSS